MNRRTPRSILLRATLALLVGAALSSGMLPDSLIYAAPAPESEEEPASNRRLYVLNYHRKMSDTDVAQFDGVIFQYTATAEKIAAVRQLNPNIVVLYYRAAWGTWRYEENWPAINKHEDWFAHGADGVSRLKKGADFYVMDLGNPGYRAYIIEYITTMVTTRGFDGAFLDGPVPTLKEVWTTPAPTGEFRAAWHENAVTFLHELKAALGSKRLITNSTRKNHDYFTRSGWSYPDPDWDDDRFLPGVDGTMIEGFAHAPWEDATRIQGERQWTQQQAKFQRNIDAGKAVYVLPGVKGGTPAERRHWAVFSYGSFLLRTDGKRSWFLWNYGETAKAHRFPELETDLGAPDGDPYLDASGVWNRDFTRGKVLVNASSHRRAIGLSRRFRSHDGAAVTGAMLQPWAAMILSE